MNYTFLSDFCTIYRIPRIQEKLNTLYPNFDQKIPYTWIEIARDTVYPKPLAGPEFSVSQFSDINHIIHESVIGLIVSSWWRFKACITSTQESVLSRGTRPLAGLKALVFVVARVRNSEARKEITLNIFTLYREKWWLPSTEVSIQTQIYSNLLTQTNFF